jgi:hypothetical protein
MKQFETVNIDDATPPQVRDFAASFLGIPVDDVTDGEVLAKVRASIEGSTIFVATEKGDPDQSGLEPVPPPDEVSGGGLVGTLGREDPKVTLTLHAEERDGVVVNRHKEVGVNGVVWLLKRGEPITIPYRVYMALRNAERHIITHTPEGEVREQVVLNTPFNVERMPPPDVIEAWHRKTDQLFVP